MSPTPMRQIASIQSLRALAALMVVIGHAQTDAAAEALKRGLAFTSLPLLPWGAGVDLFFVISGFIMVVASDRLFARPGATVTFAVRRLKRIIPLYWLFTSLYILIQLASHKQVHGGDVVASYLFWPRDVFGDGILRPVFALGWTLNYEMFFYVVFSAALVLPRRAAVLCVTAILLAGVVVGRALGLPPGPLAFWTQPIVLEFALGMGVGLARLEGVQLPGSARLGLAALALIALAIDPLGSAHQAVTWITPTDGMRLLAWGLPAGALVAAAALGGASVQLPRRAESLVAGSVRLGDASYALYLVHPFVVLTLIRVYALSGAAAWIGYWPYVALSVTLSIVVAIVVHHTFELPVARLLSLRRLEGRTVQAAP